MTSDFPDELLSAFIDDELAPAEREQVDQHLAASESSRQLVAELRSLRSEVAALPPVSVSVAFTDRVLQAAIAAAKADASSAISADLLAPPPAPEMTLAEPPPASTGSTAAIVPEPGFAGIILADAEKT
jgi:anti-sigma factor RsiW